MMRAKGITAVALALIATPAIWAADRIPHVYGPPPAWDEYRQLAEAEIARRLIDPESARITWLGQYQQGEWKPFLEGRVAGYFACGTVNARNRMGGYAGAVSFAVVIDHGRVLFAELDKRAGGMIAENCNRAMMQGLLPPLAAKAVAPTPLPAMAEVPTAATAGASGMTLRAMADGAYVGAVAPGSPAAAAALMPGMVIASVNGIPLAGMGDAMVKVVDAAGANATLAIVGGKTVKLGAQR